MLNPSLPRENIDAQAASTDGRATLYANDQTHMFERKVVIKNNGGVLNIKKQNHLFFFFSYLKRYSNTYTFLQTGTPKDKEEVNRREVSECHGWVCDLDVMDTPSKLSVLRKTAVLLRMFPTLS
jgi:hypothetical protein